MSLNRLSLDLKRELGCRTAKKCLAEAGWADVGWSDGGCLVLAKALNHWLGYGEIWGVWETYEDEYGETRDLQHHALLKVGQWFIDDAGISSKEQVLNRWDLILGGQFYPTLCPFEPDWCINSNCNAEEYTIKFLSQRFNSTTFLRALKEEA